jgi:dTDP-glucose 4,6-dehydratase
VAKRALVTGGAGFIGSHLVERLLSRGYRVVALDNFITGSPDNIAHLEGDPNFTFLRYDVTLPIYQRGPFDVILHFASPASPIDYLKHQIHTMKADSLGTLNTLGMAKEKGSRYVFASTSEVYGDPDVHPQDESYWGRVNPIGPRSVYDEAKRFGEALCMAYHRVHRVDVRIARIFNTYGPRMRIDDGRVVPNFLTHALTGKPLVIYGDGSQTRCFCFVDDLVDGIMKLVETDGISGEVFNLGSTEEHTVRELADIVLELTGAGSSLERGPLPQDDPTRRKPDIGKAGRVLRWKPRVPLEEGLGRTVKWFREKLGIP